MGAVALLMWCFCCTLCLAQEERGCYVPGDVAGIIIAAIVVTLVFVGLALGAVWYWRRKLWAALGDGCLRGGKEAEDALETDNNKKKNVALDGKFAFDNPYFRDEDQRDAQDVAEKGHANGVEEFPTGTAQQPNGKAGCVGVNGKTKKTKISNPFSSVFNLQNKKQQRTMDDSCLAVEPERVFVPLRGHDFTGLGFNICGNMRDGIFVKDVLHRGPASESGKIKAGDRILGVTVSFSKMVYEDALTILSYASPYDVQLELEKATDPANSRLHQGPPASILLAGLQGKRLGSSSFSAGQRLFHPLYRSQSIDDLTQIGKDGVHSPKRTQSIGLAVLQRSRSGHKATEGVENSKPASILVTGSLNERMLANAIVEEGLSKKALESLRETKTEESVVGHHSSDLPKFKSTVPWSVTKEISLKEEPDKKDETTTESLPRKGGKRKAPPPPPKVGNSLETEAQVHHAEDSLLAKGASSNSDDGIESDSLERPKVNGNHESDVSEDSLDEEEDGDERKSRKRNKKDNKKRKSSSLGDLTNLEEAVNKHSSQLLERTASLDLHQQSQMREDNLGNQNQNLKSPVQDDSYDAIKTFQQLSLVTSTPISELDRIALVSDLSRVGVNLSREDNTSFDGTSDSEPVHGGRKVIAVDESLRSPLLYEANSDDDHSASVQSPQREYQEVIEISQRELDDVMMSHRQFLLKQAKATGVYSGLNPPRAGPGLNFESWSYEDSKNQSSAAPVNGNSGYDTSDYKTASNSTHSAFGVKSIRSPENTIVDDIGTRTVVVSAPDSTLNDSLGMSRSSPPRPETTK